VFEILDNTPGFKSACQTVSELVPDIKGLKFSLTSIDELIDSIGDAIEERMKRIGDLMQVVRGEISINQFLKNQLISNNELDEVTDLKSTLDQRFTEAQKTVDLLKTINGFGELFGGK